jgi:hypothetical protein
MNVLPQALALLVAATLTKVEEVQLAPVHGVWILDSQGNPVLPQTFTRGLQPSGLLFRDGELWCVGDQRSRYPGHLFRLNPRTGRLIGKPVRLELPTKTAAESPEFARYRSIPNSDFEGISLLPGDPNTIFAVTEDKVPWIAEIRLLTEPTETKGQGGKNFRARIERLTPILFAPEVTPWQNDPNCRLEGCTVSDDGKTLYLAHERTRDDLPRVYRVPLTAVRTGDPVALEELAVPFASLQRREGKTDALLNLSGLQFIRLQGRATLLGVLRDQERLLLIDPVEGRLRRVIDLHLLAPPGIVVKWVSPEGLALDAQSNRLWVINDPDSVNQNYRAHDQKAPTGRFAEYVPLLFELELSDVLEE